MSNSDSSHVTRSLLESALHCQYTQPEAHSVKQIDTNTAKLLLSICRQHLDRPCCDGLPEHLEIELVAIMQAPESDVDENTRREATALLREARS
jgi:hypothetical protein